MGELGAAGPADSLIGTELGGYRIEALLGSGAVAKVYRARQISLDRRVALKVLRPSMAVSNETLTRFRREAQAAATIKHPHLIEVFDFGESGGKYYYAMELIEGRSLGRYLEKGERFSERECVEVGRQALSALDAAHKAGIVHRDVEPGNLMLGPKGRVKLGDLGLAHFTEAHSEAALTHPGVSLGTPRYMSPEQAQGLPDVDYRSDFYGLGATLFHLATGRAPYEGRTLFEIISSHLNAPVPYARDVNPEISKRFSDLIQKLMAKQPGDRPQTHTELYEALDRCRQKEEQAETRVPFSGEATIEGQRKVDTWVVVVAAIGLAAAVVFGIFALRYAIRGTSPQQVLGVPEQQDVSVPKPPAHQKVPRAAESPMPPQSMAGAQPLVEPAVPVPPPAPEPQPVPQQPSPAPDRAKGVVTSVPADTKPPPKAEPAAIDRERAEVEAIIGVLREIKDSEKEARDKRVERHLRDIEDLEKKVTARGDLDGAIAVKNERAVWTDGNTRRQKGASEASAPAELRALRQFVDRDLQMISGRHEVRWQTAKSKALAALRIIEVRLTRARRLDAAIGVRGACASIDKGEVPAMPLVGLGGKTSADIALKQASLQLASVGPSTIDLKAATKERPYVNSLGMRFVPVKGTGVLFGIWEVRVADFTQFVREKVYTSAEDPPFEQGPDHPVVMVSWNDAQAFCQWLSEKEGIEYRLPTGQEWGMAVGKDRYPWGDEFPPPRDVENLAGEEAKIGRGDPSGVIDAWRDKHPRTAPVGSYRRNRFGLYDLGGNAWEWCEDVFTERSDGRDFSSPNALRLGRGGHWASGSSPNSVASSRQDGKEPDQRDSSSGFRCVIVLPQ